MTISDLPTAIKPEAAMKAIRRTLLRRQITMPFIIMVIIAVLALLSISQKLSYYSTSLFGFILIGLTAVYVIWMLTSLKKQRDSIVRHIASNNTGTVDVSDIFAMTTAMLEDTYIAFLPNELIILNAKTHAAVHALYSDVQLVAHHTQKSRDEYVFYILGQAYAYRLVGTIDDLGERFAALDTATKLAGANIVPALGARLVYNKVNSINSKLDQRAQSALLALLALHAVSIENF